jgi:hypothetical protein
MKEMTTAEFAKANLAAIEEPVSIRRYTKTVGTYYPEGFEPASMPRPAQVSLDEVAEAAPESIKATQKIVDDLIEEVARLKQELARRPASIGATTAFPKTKAGDPFAGLAKQDREFFERKLGKKK